MQSIETQPNRSPGVAALPEGVQPTDVRGLFTLSDLTPLDVFETGRAAQVISTHVTDERRRLGPELDSLPALSWLGGTQGARSTETRSEVGQPYVLDSLPALSWLGGTEGARSTGIRSQDEQPDEPEVAPAVVGRSGSVSTHPNMYSTATLDVDVSLMTDRGLLSTIDAILGPQAGSVRLTADGRLASSLTLLLGRGGTGDPAAMHVAPPEAGDDSDGTDDDKAGTLSLHVVDLSAIGFDEMTGPPGPGVDVVVRLGRPQRKVVVVEDQWGSERIAIRSVMRLSASYVTDRVSDRTAQRAIELVTRALIPNS